MKGAIQAQLFDTHLTYYSNYKSCGNSMLDYVSSAINANAFTDVYCGYNEETEFTVEDS